MNERRDLAVTLVGATLLMLSIVALTQCSASTHTPEPASPTSVATQSVERGRGAAKKEDDEESARVKSIGHALQTIGANPEARKTYGLED
jgi:hypothetical protein